MNTRKRSGFTLIELMIVVVILAVLAATIIPQFSSSAEDAKLSTLAFNLNTLRGQIQLYKLDHNGSLPVIASDDLPQLYSNTNAAGTIGTSAAYPFGPYVMNGIPENPLNNSAFVKASATWPPAAATTDGGWFYNPSTGQVAPNEAGHLTD